MNIFVKKDSFNPKMEGKYAALVNFHSEPIICLISEVDTGDDSIHIEYNNGDSDWICMADFKKEKMELIILDAEEIIKWHKAKSEDNSERAN